MVFYGGMRFGVRPSSLGILNLFLDAELARSSSHIKTCNVIFVLGMRAYHRWFRARSLTLSVVKLPPFAAKLVKA
jgi:hypothetical protein